MAHVLRFFMTAEDELSFFRLLERYELEVYPVRVPPDWTPFRVGPDTIERLPPEEAYLAATAIAPVEVDRIKRGKDKGALRIDEVRSPVIYLERSRVLENGELLAGKMWAELEITAQTGRRDPAPDRFRKLFLEIETWMKKTFRRSEPVGLWVGPAAARAFKSGLVLLDSEHGGRPHRPGR